MTADRLLSDRGMIPPTLPERILSAATAGPEVVAITALANLALAHLCVRTALNWALS